MSEQESSSEAFKQWMDEGIPQFHGELKNKDVQYGDFDLFDMGWQACEKRMAEKHQKEVGELVEAATALHYAMDNAFISSWQTTAHWDKEVVALGNVLAKHNKEN